TRQHCARPFGQGPFHLALLIFRFAPKSGLSSSVVHCSSKDWHTMAKKQRAEQWAEHRRRREEEERQSRVMVITEFDAGDPEATMHARAAEILEYRRALRLLAKAIGLADVGAPFGVIGPGPGWRPRCTPEVPDVVPPAA